MSDSKITGADVGRATLRRCPNGHAVDDAHVHCPQCGKAVSDQTPADSRIARSWLVGGVIAFALITVAALVVGLNTGRESPRSTPSQNATKKVTPAQRCIVTSDALLNAAVDDQVNGTQDFQALITRLGSQNEALRLTLNGPLTVVITTLGSQGYDAAITAARTQAVRVCSLHYTPPSNSSTD